MVGEPAPPASCPSLLRDGGGRGDEGDGGLERQQEEGGHPGRQQQQEGSPARPWGSKRRGEPVRHPLEKDGKILFLLLTIAEQHFDANRI